MSVIRLGGFRGEIPRIHPRLLPVGAAQSAINTRMDSGAVESVKDTANLQSTTLPSPISLHRYSASVWLESTTDVDWVTYPVANDQYGRLIFADPAGSGLRVTDASMVGAGGYPSSYYNLDVPAPTQGFSAMLIGTADDDTEVPETRYYVCTFVNSWGAEGPPSPPSNQVEWRSGQTVTLSALPSVPSGLYNITYRRIYRLNTGSTGATNYQFVTEIAVLKVQTAVTSITQTNPVTVESVAHGLTEGQEALFEGLGLQTAQVVTEVTREATCMVTIPTHGLATGDTVEMGDLGNGNGMDELMLGLQATQAVTGATEADPCVLTIVGHRLITGDTVELGDFGSGNGMDELEGIRNAVTVIDVDTVSLDGIDSTGYVTYVSGGTAARALADRGIRAVITLVNVDKFRLNGVDSTGFVTYVTGGTATKTFGMDQLQNNSYFVSVVDDDNVSLLSVDGTRHYAYVSGGLMSQVAGTSYSDAVPSANLAEIIPTELYDPPNAATLGIKAHPAGWLVGFFGNTVAMSEPGAPHAWPIDYRLVTNHDVVGVGVFGGTIAVVTEGWPYLLVGSDPAAVTMVELEIEQACSAKRGIVDFGTAIAYPSPDGLIVISGQGATNATSGIFTRDQWQALVPTSFVALNWEQQYLCFYNDGSTTQAFIVNPFSQDSGVMYVTKYATGGYKDIEEDLLYLIIDDEIETWDQSATKLSYTWKSRPTYTPRAVNMAAGKIIADNYPVSLELFVDDVKRFTKTVGSIDAFRLPGGYKGEKYEVVIKGTRRVSEVSLATTMMELSAIV